MVLAKQAIWMALMIMMAGALKSSEGYSVPDTPEDNQGLEREVRAPFNGMRGKRFPDPISLNMYKKVIAESSI